VESKGKNRNDIKPLARRIKYERIEYDYHQPVLLEESVNLLITNTDGIYIDGTLGGGGHSSEILKKLSPNGRVYAFDKDKQAIEHCQKKFIKEIESKEGKQRLFLLNRSFSTACSIEELWGKTQGILLDLGLSSRQLDDSSRGFSFRANSRLNMLFGSQGRSAEEFLHAAQEEELERTFRLYGEEPFAKKIARRIIEHRRAASIKSTFELRSIIEEVVPAHFLNKSLSRVFQAIRIAVNNELEELQNMLDQSLDLLITGGRIVVISYHSLEDRIVKNSFKSHSKPEFKKSKYQSAYEDLNIATTVPAFRILTKKPIIPLENEIRFNPRARSAKMRAAEKR
jgi:16S rRNA (cytosine1402-N4)-methyltransferase